MHYAKIDFLVVIILIITFTMILISFAVLLQTQFVAKKVRQMHFLAKTLNLHNMLIPFRESSFVRDYYVYVT